MRLSAAIIVKDGVKAVVLVHVLEDVLAIVQVLVPTQASDNFIHKKEGCVLCTDSYIL